MPGQSGGGLTPGSIKQLVACFVASINGTAGPNNGLPVFLSFCGGTGITVQTEANRMLPIPFNTVVKNFYVMTTGAQPSDGAMVFTVRKNQVDSPLVVTVPISAAAGVFKDLDHSVEFAAGDLFSIKILKTSGTVGALIAAVYVVFEM